MTTKRRSLSEMAPSITAKTAEPKTPARRPPAPRSPRPTSAAPKADSVRFDELERKETRLRADQLEALAAATKRLNRARNREGSRLTDNTLIRVAVDLLMARQDDLAGTTEDELRKSVGL